MQTVTSLQNSGQLKRRRIDDQSDVVYYILHVHDRDIQSVQMDSCWVVEFVLDLVHMRVVDCCFVDICSGEGAKTLKIAYKFAQKSWIIIEEHSFGNKTPIRNIGCSSLV